MTLLTVCNNSKAEPNFITHHHMVRIILDIRAAICNRAAPSVKTALVSATSYKPLRLHKPIYYPPNGGLSYIKG